MVYNTIGRKVIIAGIERRVPEIRRVFGTNKHSGGLSMSYSCYPFKYFSLVLGEEMQNFHLVLFGGLFDAERAVKAEFPDCKTTFLPFDDECRSTDAYCAFGKLMKVLNPDDEVFIDRTNLKALCPAVDLAVEKLGCTVSGDIIAYQNFGCFDVVDLLEVKQHISKHHKLSGAKGNEKFF